MGIFNRLEKQRLAAEDIFTNSSNRVCICLCIDTSQSMLLNGRMKRVNKGVRNFIESSQDNIYASGAVDLCIVTFGGKEAKIIAPFANITKINYTDLRPGGGTPLGAAVTLAFNQIQERWDMYHTCGVSCFKPWLIIISDGISNDDVSDAAKLVRETKWLKVKCIDMSEQHEDTDLRKFTINEQVDTISALEIEDFFSVLSQSAAGLSTETPGGEGNIEL